MFPPGKTGPLLVVVLLLPGLTGCLGPGQPAPDGTPTPPGGPQPVATGSPTVRGILAVGQPTPRANQGPWLIFEEKPDNSTFRIDPTRRYEFEYDYKNEGNATLNITDVRLEPLESGGSTTGVTASMSKTTLAPGQAGELEITIDNPPPDAKGVVLHIVCNDPTRPQLVFPIRLEILQGSAVPATPNR
ncbi:MAG: hypothetical protein ACJ78Q_08035 [Chloroflexia bacterium]